MECVLRIQDEQRESIMIDNDDKNILHSFVCALYCKLHVAPIFDCLPTV